jgi:hypothetical protein
MLGENAARNTAPTPWTGLGSRQFEPPHSPSTGDANASKTSRMREYLVEHGPTNASDLARVAGLTSTALVSALFKYDIANGRVQFSQGLYQWIESDDQAEIREAIGLLRRHGYTVKAPREVAR